MRHCRNCGKLREIRRGAAHRQPGALGIFFQRRARRPTDIVWNCSLEPQVVQGSAEQFINRIYPDDLSDLQRAITRSIRTGRPFEHQFRFIRDDESIGMVYTAGNTVMDEAGMPLRMTGIIQDISGPPSWRTRWLSLLNACPVSI